VRELLADGYEVKAFIMPNSPSKTLSGLQIEYAIGNICHLEEVVSAMHGCGMVIHAAASTRVWPTRSKDIWDINLTGTQNVVEAAIQCNIQRLVYVSSAVCFSPGSKSHPGTEDNPFNGYHYHLDYVDSKYAAQEYVLKATREKKLPAVLINPTFMFGEYDSQPSSGKMIVAMYKGSLPGFTNGGKNFVYANDVARACVNALKMGRIGACYIAGNVNLSYQELFGKMARILKVKPPRIRLPNVLILTFGYLSTFFGKLLHRNPNLNHGTARVSCDEQYYTNQKAVEELKMPQTPIDTAIENAFTWLKINHYC
jgi:dihydroflavonol-4-reductase